MAPILAVRDLVKTYHVGDHVVRALRGANMDVQRGEFVAITGPSGSGKSTLMHILGCLDRPTSGQYVLDGQDVSRMSKDELAIIRSRKFEFSPEEKQVILQGRGPRSKGPVTPVTCPRCSTRMERLYLDSSVHLVLDRCTDHGVWLDTGEIKAVQAVAEASVKASKLLLRMLNARKGRTD